MAQQLLHQAHAAVAQVAPLDVRLAHVRRLHQKGVLRLQDAVDNKQK